MVRNLSVFAVFLCAWAPTAEAGASRGFLASADAAVANDPLAPLCSALKESGSTAEVEERVTFVTEAMRLSFLALPRSREGYLEASAVRYLLHRYFIERDGWFVQGWDGLGEAAEHDLPKIVLQGGGALAALLSERLADRGLSLREVAILAMGLETLASKETEQRLHAAYRLMNLPHREDHASESELSLILKAYMIIYLGSFDHAALTRTELDEYWETLPLWVPKWDELEEWFQQVRSEVLDSIPQHPEQRASFGEQVHVLEEVQHRYARWQDQKDCLSIKSELMKYATPGTGRVPLNAFYSASLPGGWRPAETKEYLHEMGALDETDPEVASVMVPNYFDTPSNCANTSKYYSVCCISECEALLGDLERRLGSPNALPQQIVQVVESLSSAAVAAPRTLPAQLVQRLEGIAELHGGHAPLHGRLFRQWMHHAFPAECVFPALSTAKKPRTTAEFLLETGHDAIMSPEAVAAYTALAALRRVANDLANDFPELPWSDEEELFVVCRADGGDAGPAASSQRRSSLGWVWRGLVLFALVMSMGYMLVETAVSGKRCIMPPRSKVSMA